MKPLTQSLDELGARVKVMEASAAATLEADRTKFEKRRREIDDEIKTDVDQFESALREVVPAEDTSELLMRPYFGSWKRLAVHGVAAVLFGLATLVWPGITLWSLVVLWGAYAFVDGITDVSAAITDRLLVHRGWVAFTGVTGILAGVVTFLWPSMTALALLVVIATWSLVVGGSRIAFAISARKELSDAWVVGLGGALLVLLGVVLLADPGAGAIGITWAIGWFVFVSGTLELWMAARVRRETHEQAAS